MTCYLTFDVFTDNPFGGNPLAVIPDATALPEDQLQKIAREFNYSETTFVYPPTDPAHTAKVRIFTPTMEVPFAGHPTIGTAVALARAGHGPDMVLELGVGPIRAMPPRPARASPPPRRSISSPRPTRRWWPAPCRARSAISSRPTTRPPWPPSACPSP